jgi:enamine deaminase RidA (YjgF/YER057c/UK114 family)
MIRLLYRFRILKFAGGWDRVTEEFPKDLGEEVNQVFDNVQHTLEKAGGKGWDQVYKIRVYVSKNAESSFLDAMGHVIRNLTQWCPNHEPLLTAVEVAGLYNDMRIEIEAEAHLR